MSKPYAKSLPLTPERISRACELLEWSRTLEEHGLMEEEWLEKQANERLERLRATMIPIGVSPPSSTGAHPERRLRTAGATA